MKKERYLFYCPTCNSFYSKDTENPNEEIKCENCNSSLKPTFITKAEWDNKSTEEKDSIKKEFNAKYVKESQRPQMKCPKCGKEIAIECKKCPECGYKLENEVAVVLKFLGMVIIIGGIIGSMISTQVLYLDNIVMIIGIILSVISGYIIMGFAEIITLNQKIFNLLRK